MSNNIIRKNILYLKKKNNSKIDNLDDLYDLDDLDHLDDNNYSAIIVEPRKHKALEFVLDNFTKNLDNKWKFIIICSSNNKEYIENIKNKLNIDINIIAILKDNLSIREYNSLLTSKNFYNLIPTEIFLIFQTDSMILEKNKYKINDFLKYDYVGAPWINGKVGNGGLSLRRKSIMLDILNKKLYNHSQNEDYYFSLSFKINKPDYNKAKEFSIETCYYDNPFGIHKIWKYLNQEDYNKLIKEYPEINELKKLQ